ncbi:MAG: hypothetical protein IT355_13770 [Gemmatimonadaceae bacterium]|nr:hypothetical protein [Gemmatimonadaceae bacterium]
MFRRSVLQAALSTALGVWTVLSGAVSAAAAPCAMHGGAPADGGTGRHPAAHGMMTAAHHAAAGDRDEATDTRAPDDRPDAAHRCTCAGDCCGVIAVAPTTAAPALARVTVTEVPVVTPLAVAPPLASRDRLLPFANGPPVTRSP